jgi:hypothetical protein
MLSASNVPREEKIDPMQPVPQPANPDREGLSSFPLVPSSSITPTPYLPLAAVGAPFNANNAKCPPTTGRAMNGPSAKLFTSISTPQPNFIRIRKKRIELTLQSEYYRDP